jgi:site-specific DNA-methyltransferase (adenine-specific)
MQICTPLGRVNNKLAKDSGVSARQFHKIEFVLEKAPEDLKQKVLDKKVKPDRAYKDIQNKHWLDKQISDNKKLDASFEKAIDKISLYKGDFRNVAFNKLQADSVSLIFTDPLYDKESLHLYKDLAKLSEIVLKPGGSLITYIGQYAWHEILNIVERSLKLQLWWTFAIDLEGPVYGRMYSRQMVIKWKPLLWFVKGNKPINPSFPLKGTGKSSHIADLIESKASDKRFHDFAQNSGDAEYILNFLTAHNDLILDPFVGGGSTAVACMNLKRRFVGIDIDPTAIERTKANLRINLEISKTADLDNFG